VPAAFFSGARASGFFLGRSGQRLFSRALGPAAFFSGYRASGFFLGLSGQWLFFSGSLLGLSTSGSLDLSKEWRGRHERQRESKNELEEEGLKGKRADS
jgi:hypothetical protein